MTPPAERIARATGVAALMAALVFSVWRQLAPGAACGDDVAWRIDSVDDAAATSLARAIGAREATIACAASPVAVRLTTVPSAAVRAVLAVARDAGARVTWQDSTQLRDVAFGAAREPAPRSTFELAARASVDVGARAALVLRDAGGVIDSLDGSGDGAFELRVRAAGVRAPVTAEIRRGARTVVRAPMVIPAAPTMRGVRLYAQPGWESKFVSAALEESGWTIDGALAIAPRASVRLGTPSDPDTARYSAVVVLDSGLVAPRSLERFVEQGGGVVIAGDALRDAALAAFASVSVQADRAPIAGGLVTDAPRGGLAAWRLALRAPMTIVERDAVAPIVVASRRTVGRVLASGYRGTWHWRMEGTDDGADDHRRWWNGLVARVAFASFPASPLAATPRGATPWPGDAAPLADLIARIGAGVAVSGAVVDASAVNGSAMDALASRVTLWVLFAIAALALLSEWAMRRFRGAP